MTAEELKIKYPEAVEMIDKVTGKDKVYYIRGNRTVHQHETDVTKYYYNYEGTHIRLFPDLETMVKWFDGNQKEHMAAEKKIKNFGWSHYLSAVKGEEVWLDEKNNVSEEFCDFKNSDFTKAELARSKRIENGKEEYDGEEDEDDEKGDEHDEDDDE